MIQLYHIINPVRVTQSSDLFYAQPITFESMKRAQSFCQEEAEIFLVTTQYEEDLPIIPDYFKILSNLERSILDVHPELKRKKLPLIKDILQKAVEECPLADYIIYTNVDIGLMPHFYDFVIQKIHLGHDAIVINRRRIPNRYFRIEDLPSIYSDLGRSHPGFDCFVIKKSIIEQFILDDICIGISFLEACLVHNIFSFAQNPLFIPDGHLTFHIGMDVLVPRNNDFYRHNRKTFFNKIYPQLKPHFDLKKFPYGNVKWPKRAINWMLNPALFTRNYLNLEGKSIKQKVKTYLDEIRWRILQK